MRYAPPMLLLPALALLGCHPDPVDSAPVGDTAPWIAPGCGDDVLDPNEACDDGAANSDTTPDACRSDCVLPTCGDGVVDPSGGEACDDAESWGGDGCSATCTIETGTAEVEPNETWDAATPTGTSRDVTTEADGSLPARDTDCWSVAVPACGAVSARETGPCGATLELALHDPSGALVAAGGPGVDGCAVLDPAEEPGARWIAT